MGLDNFGIKMVVSKDSFGRQSQNERSIFKKKKKQIITAASFGWMGCKWLWSSFGLSRPLIVT